MHCWIVPLLLAFIAFRLVRRFAWARHGGCGGGGYYGRHHHGRHGGWHGRWGRGGGPVYSLFGELGTTREQEKVILDAWRELTDEARSARGEWRASRDDVGAAFGDDNFDAERLGHTFARHDEVLEKLRKAFVGAVAKIHDVLDEKQRARLRDLIERGPFGGGMGGFGPFGGPYR